MSMFSKKKMPTSHEKTIAIDHLRIRQSQLREHIKDNPDKDTWCTEHDIKCIENVIAYLESR